MATPYINRDISWLSFNERVLQEAKDMGVPLLERLKFLAIYSSNLDEFFKVRVANHRNLLKLGKKTKKKLAEPPKEVLKNILKIVNNQQEEFSRIFEKEIIPQLKDHRIFLLKRLELNEEQLEFLYDFFEHHMLPYVQPVLLVKNKIQPFLNNAALYLAVTLLEKDKGSSNNDFDYALIKIPSDHLPRFIKLPAPAGEYHLIMIDDVVRQSIQKLFPGYRIIDSFSIKLTRDAELYIDDEYSGDLISKIKKSLKKRNVGPASRFVYDRSMPKYFLSYLQEVFHMKSDFDIFPEGRYHNNFAFFGFPDFGMKHLKYTPLSPFKYVPLENTNTFFQEIAERDHLIHVPYHSYRSVVRFFKEAANDPFVTHIKMVQYRVAKYSEIMEYLIQAVKNGKHVSVFIEVKARFDEEANLAWGERLEENGVHVQYSFPGLKVHSKLALIRRKEKDSIKLYSYLGTGNFHEGTAKIYSDFGLFTSDKRLTTEVENIFTFFETVKYPKKDFEHLLVGQFNLRSHLVFLIDQEIESAKNGKKAHIFLKMNSLQDPDMIDKLYEASNAGVKIDLIVRGICSLVPQVKGYSENITAISIVDRYLEHARVFVFHNNGDKKMYLSSADWMTRNLSYRIETTFPIYDKKIKKLILKLMDFQLNDNSKSRIIDVKGKNKYARNDSHVSSASQLETYFYLKKL